MKLRKIGTYTFLLMLLFCLTLFVGCTKETTTPTNDDSPITDNSEMYLERIATLEAELQKQKEERYISDAAYTATIEALQSKLDAMLLDKETNVTPGKAEEELSFSYLLKNGKITITGYQGTSTLITIPAVLDGYPVVAIGERAFEGQRIAAVILPDGLETIGWFAFYGCETLIDVSIPTSVTSIGYAVFDGCENLSIICASGSYAEQYAVSYGLPHISQ